MNSIIPLFPGLPGGPELLIVLFVLVLLFGANKIPKLARSTGQAMGEFKRGREEIEDELEEMAGENTAERQPTDRPTDTGTDAGANAERETADRTPDEETEEAR